MSAGTWNCRIWLLERGDGLRLGFTDHDRDLAVAGLVARADTGLTARALEVTSGLAVDNSEALGALSDAAITAEDLDAGRWDGADLRILEADWRDPASARVIFRGTVGEVSRKGAEFRAELRGMAEALNRPLGHVHARSCSAVLGDGRCRFDLSTPGFRVAGTVQEVREAGRVLVLSGITAPVPGWFDGGRLEIASGAGEGLFAMVRAVAEEAGHMRVELWQAIRGGILTGDGVLLSAGCDKRAESCRVKFDNILNFRGFPHLPGEDWLTAWPGMPGQAGPATTPGFLGFGGGDGG